MPTSRIKKPYIILLTGLFILIIAVVLWFTRHQKEYQEMAKSIAVLPFKNLSNNSEEQYLADGMMDAILNHLQKIRELEVRSRTSVEQFREPDLSLPEIGKQLNVNYIIEGSFQKVGEEANLVVQLIVAQEDKHIWSKDYTRNWSDIFSVQSKVAQSIASELQMVLSSQEQELINRKPTENLEAYDYFLRGKENNIRYFFSQDEQDFENAISLFRHVLDLDPDFIQVYAELSWTFWWRYLWGSRSGEYNYLDSAIEYGQQAVKFDPELSDGYALLGLFKVMRGKYDEASLALNRAKELKPNDPRIYRFLGLLSHNKGNYVEAIEYYMKADKLEHTNYEILILKLKIIEFFLDIGAYQEARIFIDDLMQLEPDYPAGYVLSALLELQNGHYEGALITYQNALKGDHSRINESRIKPYLYKSTAETLAYLERYSESLAYWLKAMDINDRQDKNLDMSNFRYAYSLWMSGDKYKAEQLFERFILFCENYINGDTYKPQTGVHYKLAAVYAFLGDDKEALRNLEEQGQAGYSRYSENGFWFAYDHFILYDPMFDPIREDDRFKQIVERAQLEKDRIRTEVLEMFKTIKNQAGEHSSATP
jgi:TolB-like protein/Tfp pilus assembly protein PilF